MILLAQSLTNTAAGADPDVVTTISLGTQLGAAALLVTVMMLVHGAGIVTATRLLRLKDRDLMAHRVDFRAFGLLTSIALCLFALHVIEIALFALFYLWVGAIEQVEPALYFSASAYATLGQPDMQFPDEWRLVGALEGLVGFLLIGWSTAVFITDMSKLLRQQDEEEEMEDRQEAAERTEPAGAAGSVE